MSWTRERIRHAAHAVRRQDRHGAVPVYDSIGSDFPLALAPGWLNLGLWDDPSGDPGKAQAACIRLVEHMAAALPLGSDILDVANGLGAQDPVIAGAVEPERLVAVNITGSQLRAGRDRLRAAGADPVQADAVSLPFAAESFDGLISVEAAFHFASRERFFGEAFRVLRPGGVLVTSDVPAERTPRTPSEILAGLGQLRVWGLHRESVMSAAEIAAACEAAGFQDVRVELRGEWVIDPAVRYVKHILPTARGLSRAQRTAVGVFVRHIELLRRNGVIDYLFLFARKLA